MLAASRSIVSGERPCLVHEVGSPSIFQGDKVSLIPATVKSMGLQSVSTPLTRSLPSRLLFVILRLAFLHHLFRIAKGEDNPSWHHEHFIRGRPDLLHKIRRNRVKATQGNAGPRATSKPKEALVQTTSDDSSDGASDYIEDISVNESATRAGGYEYSSANANEMMRRVSTAIPNDASAFEDKVFDEKLNSMFSERTSSQNSGYAKIELMRLEPLPIHCAGILDSTDTRNNNDLAAFGQLLDRL